MLTTRNYIGDEVRLASIPGTEVVNGQAIDVKIPVVRLDGEATPVTIPGSVEISNDTGNAIPVRGQASRALADAPFIRPANGNAAAINTVLGSADGAVLKFSDFFPVAGGHVLLTGARLTIAKAGEAFSTNLNIRAYLFSADPAGSLVTNADGGVFKLLRSFNAARLGHLDFMTWSTGGAGSDLVEAYAEVHSGPTHLVAGAASRDLYAILVAMAAFSKVSGATIELEARWAGL
jgi:hypothetical protein